MNYKRILVVSDVTPAGKARIRAASDIAARFKAGLTGAFLKSEHIPNYFIGDGLILPSVNVETFLAERAAENSRLSAAAEAVFRDLAGQRGIDLQWTEINGDSDLPLAAYARRHDLTVLPVETSAALASHRINAAAIGLACGGPLMIIPERGFPSDFGGNVLVAWNDTRESARALRDALPFLQQAKEIHVLTVGPSEETELDPALQDFFTRHGCPKARLVVDRNEGLATGFLIRRQIDMVGATLVVLGLYGHSRLRELVLGGVSRTLLEQLPMPALFSH